MVTQTFWSERTQSAISPRILYCFNKQKYTRIVHFMSFTMIRLFVYKATQDKRDPKLKSAHTLRFHDLSFASCASVLTPFNSFQDCLQHCAFTTPFDLWKCCYDIEKMLVFVKVKEDDPEWPSHFCHF